MKKQLIPLFVMSIISIVFSVIMLGIGIWLIPAIDDLPETVAESNDGILMLLSIFGSIIIMVVIVFVIIAFAVTALLGTFGLISALKNGRFSLACVILGSLTTLISLTAIPSLFISISNNDFEPIFLIPLVYFGGYTACSIIAFIYRKKAAHEQIIEKPYELSPNIEENKL